MSVNTLFLRQLTLPRKRKLKKRIERLTSGNTFNRNSFRPLMMRSWYVLFRIQTRVEKRVDQC